MCRGARVNVAGVTSRVSLVTQWRHHAAPPSVPCSAPPLCPDTLPAVTVCVRLCHAALLSDAPVALWLILSALSRCCPPISNAARH